MRLQLEIVDEAETSHVASAVADCLTLSYDRIIQKSAEA